MSYGLVMHYNVFFFCQQSDQYIHPIQKQQEDDQLTAVNVDTSHLDSPPKPKEVKNWPKKALNVGQITAVAINLDGNPVIFHRADRVWNEE